MASCWLKIRRQVVAEVAVAAEVVDAAVRVDQILKAWPNEAQVDKVVLGKVVLDKVDKGVPAKVD